MADSEFSVSSDTAKKKGKRRIDEGRYCVAGYANKKAAKTQVIRLG